MSDLTERARRAAGLATGETARLLTDLADEIDRLRLIADRTPETADEVLRLRAEVGRLIIEREAWRDEVFRAVIDRDKRILRLTAELETAKRVERERWESIRAAFGPGVGPR